MLTLSDKDMIDSQSFFVSESGYITPPTHTHKVDTVGCWFSLSFSTDEMRIFVPCNNIINSHFDGRSCCPLWDKK